MEVHHARISLRQDTATKSDKAMTIGLIVAVLILVGAVFNQTSGEHQVNQPSTQSMADDNTKVQ